MRIGIDYTAAVNQSAGIGRFVRNLVEAVTEMDSRNEYVLLHAAPNPGCVADPPSAPNVSVRALRFSERFMATLWHRLEVPLPVELVTGPVDVFHSPDFVLPPVRRAVRLITIHDLAFLTYPECAHERLRAYLEYAVPRSAARADYIITDSENTRNDVICLLDRDPDEVFVVPGGVDPMFQPASADSVAGLREQYQLTQPYVLAVGVIEPRKNYPRLIQAFGRLRAQTGVPCQLVIAGGLGWLSEETLRQAEQSAYPGDVRFVGYVPDRQLPALYTGAEVFAYPSLYEGFGLPVLEAMACGTPVVCANTSSLPEFATDAALLVPPEDPHAIADALETAWMNRSERERLRAAGIRRVQDYTWQQSAERLVQIYERVCA